MSFVWKPAHFKFQSYGGALHKAKIVFVEKYTYLVIFHHFKSLRVSSDIYTIYSVAAILED